MDKKVKEPEKKIIDVPAEPVKEAVKEEPEEQPEKEVEEASEEPSVEELVKQRKKESNVGWIVVTLILLVAIILSIGTKGFTDFNGGQKQESALPINQVTCGLENGLAISDAVDKAILKVDTLLAPGQHAILINSTEESGMYRFAMDIDNRTYNSFVTKDAKYLMPTAIEISNITVGITQ